MLNGIRAKDFWLSEAVSTVSYATAHVKLQLPKVL